MNEDFENWEPEFESCDECGSDLYWEDCWSCGGEGGTDGEELMMEDPFWYSPDDFRTCDICDGKGGWNICLNAKNHKKEKLSA